MLLHGELLDQFRLVYLAEKLPLGDLVTHLDIELQQLPLGVTLERHDPSGKDHDTVGVDIDRNLAEDTPESEAQEPETQYQQRQPVPPRKNLQHRIQLLRCGDVFECLFLKQ